MPQTTRRGVVFGATGQRVTDIDARARDAAGSPGPGCYSVTLAAVGDYAPPPPLASPTSVLAFDGMPPASPLDEMKKVREALAAEGIPVGEMDRRGINLLHEGNASTSHKELTWVWRDIESNSSRRLAQVREHAVQLAQESAAQTLCDEQASAESGPSGGNVVREFACQHNKNMMNNNLFITKQLMSLVVWRSSK